MVSLPASRNSGSSGLSTQVLLFDRRCTGNSSCPTGEKANRHALFDLKLGDRLTANIAVARVRAPLLVADAPDDSDSPITEVQTLLRRARLGVVLFVRLPAGAGHGRATVNDPNDPNRRSAFSARLTTFLDRLATAEWSTRISLEIAAECPHVVGDLIRVFAIDGVGSVRVDSDLAGANCASGDGRDSLRIMHG